LIASFAEERSELVVEPELTLREDGPCLLSRLSERNDRVATDGDTASVIAGKEDKGLGAAFANADSKAGDGRSVKDNA
jgi:hypothetical protein